MLGSAVGAALGVALAPRRGESRRAALDRLRLALRPGRGAVGAFAGTPCSSADLDSMAVDGRMAEAARSTTGGADDG